MKRTLDAINVLYPTPTTIVGAIVNDKPNWPLTNSMGPLFCITQICFDPFSDD